MHNCFIHLSKESVTESISCLRRPSGGITTHLAYASGMHRGGGPRVSKAPPASPALRAAPSSLLPPGPLPHSPHRIKARGLKPGFPPHKRRFTQTYNTLLHPRGGKLTRIPPAGQTAGLRALSHPSILGVAKVLTSPTSEGCGEEVRPRERPSAKCKSHAQASEGCELRGTGDCLLHCVQHPGLEHEQPSTDTGVE